jgi:5-methylcytosine-specific restriction endonuclease McrA
MEGSAVTRKEPIFKIDVSEKAWKLLQELKEKMGNYQDGELLEFLLQEKTKELAKPIIPPSIKPSKPEANVPKSMAHPHSRYIPKSVREAVVARAQGRCEYLSPLTHERCTEVHHMVFDHRHAHAIGGGNSIQNIRYLCKNHNLLHAIHTYGSEKMDSYLGRR